MSTYGELASEVLGMLDQPLDTGGDVLANIETKLARINQNICAELRPGTLLFETSAFSVTSSTTAIALVADFGVTLSTFDRIFQIRIDENPTATREDIQWEIVEWETWLRMDNRLDGRQRASQDRAAYDSRTRNFYLSRWPATGSTFNAYLEYYQLPAAYNSANTPETPVAHHGVLSYGSILEFPQYFKEERALLFAYYQREYEAAKKSLFGDRMINAKRLSFSISPGHKRSSGARINWGDA